MAKTRIMIRVEPGLDLELKKQSGGFRTELKSCKLGFGLIIISNRFGINLRFGVWANLSSF